MDPISKKIINEKFVNLLPGDEEEKKKHAHHVHAMLKKAYEKIGVLKGDGTKSPEDLVKHIPFWKLHKHEGKIKSVSLYKDKGGRKRVAMATDGSHEGKKGLEMTIKDDIKQKRSYGEISGKALSFTKKHIDLTKHAHSAEDAIKQAKSNGDEARHPPEDDGEVQKHPELKKHFYQRKIGGEWHTKIMVGTKGKKIK